MRRKSLSDIWSSVHDNFKNPGDIVYLAFVGFLVGVSAGCVIAVFRLAKATAYHGVLGWLGSRDSFAVAAYFVLAIIAALIVGRLIKNKAIQFGGAAWIREALIDGQNRPWAKILFPKFLGIWLVLSAGVSVGSEGPCIEMGAASALGLKTFDKQDLIERRFFILGGCAAGLAAAFSAPIAGICYVYEVMKYKMDKMLLLFLLGGSMGVYFSVSVVFGLDTMLPLGEAVALDLAHIWLLIPLALFCAMGGIAYNYLLRLSIELYDRQTLIPQNLRPLLPFLGAGAIMLICPVLSGEGSNIFASFYYWDKMLEFLLFFVAAKLLFTAFCYGSGIPAGEMVPILCIGGAMGGIFAAIASAVGVLPPGSEVTMTTLGMAAAFTAAECAPLTGVILVSQMTGTFEAALPMLFVTFIAWIAARYALVKAP